MFDLVVFLVVCGDDDVSVGGGDGVFSDLASFLSCFCLFDLVVFVVVGVGDVFVGSCDGVVAVVVS